MAGTPPAACPNLSGLFRLLLPAIAARWPAYTDRCALSAYTDRCAMSGLHRSLRGIRPARRSL